MTPPTYESQRAQSFTLAELRKFLEADRVQRMTEAQFWAHIRRTK